MKDPNRNKLGKRIAPGIWEDASGNPHFSLPELLALVDLEDNPANRKAVTEMLRDLMKKKCPDAKIVERPTPND